MKEISNRPPPRAAPRFISCSVQAPSTKETHLQRTHIVTGLAASVGTLTIAAAFGFAQPDGLEPPTGPVVDTQPSLASIRAELDNLASGFASPGNQLVATPRVANNSTFILDVDRIRLARIHMLFGNFRVVDADGVQFSVFAGQSLSGPRAEPIEFNFDVDLRGPVVFTGAPNTLQGSEATIIYQELP